MWAGFGRGGGGGGGGFFGGGEGDVFLDFLPVVVLVEEYGQDSDWEGDAVGLVRDGEGSVPGGPG